MAGLLDIAPSVEQINVRGTDVQIKGISAKGLTTLLSRFPEIQNLITGGEIDVTRMFDMGSDIVAAIIAAGCGQPGDLEAEKVASSLSLEIQAQLLEAIIRQTMPSGIGPFVARIESLGDVLNVRTQPQSESGSLPHTTPNGYDNQSAAISQ